MLRDASRLGMWQRSILIATWLLMLPIGAAAADEVTIQLALNGIALEGMPLAWNDAQVLVLGRDGHLFQFAPNEAAEYRQVSNGFRPWSQSQMRGELQREFGKRFEISGTGNYLVVHPAGQKDRWAVRFEQLYRSFIQYFSVRGARPTAPSFPLVAVACHSQSEFLRYSQQHGGSISPGVLGFYSPRTNRVMLYDVTQGAKDDENWHVNAATILHEATHQVAFNTGLHNRAAPPPRWIGEGLAMLFEAPGIWNPRHFRDAEDRINHERLEAFRAGIPYRTRDSLARLVSQSVRDFSRTPSQSYAEAWAFTFFLSEQEPRRFAQYLAKTAAREPLRKYNGAEQLQEFTDVFGRDLTMLEARFLRFVQQLP